MRIHRLRYAIGPGYISKSVKEDGKRKRVEKKIEWRGKIHVRRYSLFFLVTMLRESAIIIFLFLYGIL